MKTLFEDVYRTASDYHKSYMETAEVIYIQNVADYLYSLEKEYVDMVKDFPNVAPPFPCFWMEFSIPQRLYDGQTMRDIEWYGTRFGFLFTNEEIGEDDLFWEMRATGFVSPGGDAARHPGEVMDSFRWEIEIDKDGKIRRDVFGVPSELSLTVEEQMELESQAEAWSWNMLCPCLLAISFLHCKNVSIVSHEPPAKRSARRNRPKIRFHTLHIEPIKRILKTEGGAEETGIKHALHICRGHFKDFTKGKGLFGRYKEIYWWDSQVRGSGIKGAVLKDYEVANNLPNPLNFPEEQ